MKTICFAFLTYLSAMMLAQKNADVTLYFHDGSVLYGNAKMKDITLNTSYGKLNIPLKDVSQILFGIEKDESIAADINKYIQLLANTSDEKNIQSASESISKYGLKAIYYLKKFLETNTSCTNIGNIENILEEILSANNITEYNLTDIIVLNNGDKISGQVDFKSLEFNNNFLSTSIGVNKIKSMDIFYFDSKDGIFNFSIKASKYIMANTNGGWFNTGIKVKKGQTIEISARGEIVLASLDNKKYTPDGYVVGTAPPTTEETNSEYFNYGTLIFKIGNNGKHLKAGSFAKYIADADGVIFLTIYETVYSEKNTGAYQVKLSVK